ncbi:MAG: M4 family metallopeptidase, partial [Chloroflexota bacterium]
MIGNGVGSDTGGGIGTFGGTVTLKNTIVARNSASTAPDCSGSVTSTSYNLIGNNSGCTFTATTGDQVGTNVSPINPLLSPLQDNSGPTFTHALLTGSPAINAGNPASPGSGGNACLAIDQRGVTRPVSTRCDIGAFEGSTSGISFPFLLTYTANNGTGLPGIFLCAQSASPCTGTDPHADAAHLYANHTYNFYATYHNRDSINNAGMTIISTVHYSTNYANAFWNGSQMVYGDAYGFPLADDVVGHELTHGVTDYESNLFYYYQSGAINESFSDVWGEFVDLTNGAGNDSAAVRWKMGEDVSGLGALRDMKNPPVYGDPDKITSTLYYKGAGDNGGVHTNSGVNNKAVYLMTDGGTFNGKTVTGLGIPKVAAIYYEAQTNLLTSGSDYADLYYALSQACATLVGGAQSITNEDCQEVRDAADAVQMNSQPAAGYNPEAALCPAGMGTDLSTQTLFFDDLETSAANWTFGAVSGPNTWNWTTGYAANGLYRLWGNNSAGPFLNSFAAMNVNVTTLPANAFLHFKHSFGFEDYNAAFFFDGGLLEYSTNDGASWIDAKSLFSDGKNYGGKIYTGFSNPNSGKDAFVADSHGYVSSRYNLNSLAGQSVR